MKACGLTIYGTPFSPKSRSPNGAFQADEKSTARRLRQQCPADVDIILTHSCGTDDADDGDTVTAAIAGLAPK